VFGAATAWTGAKTTPEEFDPAFAATFLGQPDNAAAVAAMRRLGRAVTGPGLGRRNSSNLALGLFEDPLKGRLAPQIESQSLTEVIAAANDAISAWSTISDASLRYDYGFTSRLIAFAASKLLRTQRLQAALRAKAPLDAEIEALEADRARGLALRAEFETCWLRHARRSEIDLTLRQFKALEGSYDRAGAWLTTQQTRSASGEPVDSELSSYQAESVAFLWEQGLNELRRLAEVAGDEALPENVRAWLRSA
jgi:hypothetical protein